MGIFRVSQRLRLARQPHPSSPRRGRWPAHHLRREDFSIGGAAGLTPSSRGAPPSPLTTELVRLASRPFGLDERGRPIRHGSGKLVVGAIEYMQEVVGRRATVGAPPGLAAAARDDLMARAQSAALDRLVAMVNAAIADERYHVTRDYLLDESNKYSYEFRLFVADYCRVISGDPDFFFHQGAKNIPTPMIHIARPLGIQRSYAVLPRMTAKFVQTDLRVVRTTPTSAVIRWYGVSQIAQIPPQHRLPYIRYACQTYQGTFAAIPSVAFGLPPGGARQHCCQADGADYCEWEFTWQRVEQPSLARWLGGGLVGGC